MDKQTIHLDASILKNFNCFRYYYWKAVKGKSQFSKSTYKQAFGTAIHRFLQDFYSGKKFQDCVQSGSDYYKDYAVDVPPDNPLEYRYMTNLLAIFLEYGKIHKRSQVGEKWEMQKGDFIPFKIKDKTTLETKFSIPVFETEKFILCLSGTIDMLASYGGHDIVVVDHKTTGMPYIEKFFTNFELDIQTMLYSRVCKDILGLDYYPPIVINGFFLKKPTQKAQKEGRFDGCNFTVSPLFMYSESQMKAFNFWLASRIEAVTEAMKRDFVGEENNYNYSACHTAWGQCEFFNVCKCEPEFHETILERDFVDREYNPMQFQN